MAQHIVMCMVCKEKFDLNTIQGVKYKVHNRYAHQKCYPEGELVPMEKPHALITPGPKVEDKDATDYKNLTDYINELFNKNVNWGFVGVQLKSYHEKFGYTYSGMLKSLKYAYEIRHDDITKAQGVGVIPLYYKPAYEYYYSIWEAQQRNNNVKISKSNGIEIHIPPPTVKQKKRNLFSFLDEEGKNQ